jgi:hypothetical protein
MTRAKIISEYVYSGILVGMLGLIFPIIEIYVVEGRVAYSHIFGSKEPFVICIIMTVSSIWDSSKITIEFPKSMMLFASITMLLASALLYAIAMLHARLSEAETDLQKLDIANTSLVFIFISIVLSIFARVLSFTYYEDDTSGG